MSRATQPFEKNVRINEPISNLLYDFSKSYFSRNMAYPDFIVNDTLLTQYYQEMELFEDTDTLKNIEDKIFRWSMWKTLSRLNRPQYQRDHFDLPPGLVNAWYLVSHFFRLLWKFCMILQ